MSRESNILKNTAVYAVGNLGSKILAYIMVLVYTHYINSNELGYYDLILTTINLILPIVLWSFDEGIYRWLIDSTNDNIIKTISTCFKTILGTTFLIGCCLLIVDHIVNIKYVWLIVLLLSSMAIYQLFLSAVRGLSNSKTYAISGVINSTVDLALEFVGLVFFHMGVEVLLFSKVFANLITIGYLSIRQKELRSCIKANFSVKIAKALFKYSLPLIPNAVSWWIVNSSDRYIILFFLGTAYNGIYSISNKFPTIITTITGIVYFSLQESIIKEYGSQDRDQFYSKIFKKYYTILFSLVICAIPATKLVIQWFVSTAYRSAWEFTGFLYISTVFSALSAFLGIGYQISKETKRSVISTVSAAGINALINIVLIDHIGLYAASFSTMVAYIFLFGLRIKHSRKYFQLNIQWTHFLTLILCVCMSMIVSYLPDTLDIMISELLLILFVLVGNRKLILDLLGIVKKR